MLIQFQTYYFLIIGQIVTQCVFHHGGMQLEKTKIYQEQAAFKNQI